MDRPRVATRIDSEPGVRWSFFVLIPVNALDRQLTALEPLELRHLPADGLAFDEPLPTAWLTRTLDAVGRAGGLQFAAPGDGRVTLEVTPLGPVDQRPPIRVRGRISATAETDCVRCLETVRPEVSADVDLTLLPAAAPASSADDAKTPKGKSAKIKPEDDRVEDWSDEAFPNPDELADASYAGERVDLPALIGEAFLLALPSDPVCEDEAACDTRTAALIEHANQPAREAADALDPRWAALRNLKVEDDDPA